ncbi:hypothetical protein QJS10_CPA10g00094 [Acorus calamus]|uniref:Non-structural maintenance of chromosomes element 4 n=1 Tax=Acorus calamus TaxID=4465 RepID=A0AAV9E6C8_ACOCL|nr:hypothetical protein QJS10_CPA10g00094 [Acorus calamus]
MMQEHAKIICSNSFTEGISEKENAYPQHEEEDGGHIDNRDLHNLRLGPMDNRISHKKLVRKRARPVEISHPEEVNNVGSMDRITTEENVAKMFDVLKKQRLVILEELVLNRTSFSKTIKNIFSLSFLVKDGRAKIGVDNNGAFFISPRNAPAAMAVANGEIKFHHFILRFDYNDWKLMINNVNNEEGATQHGSRVEGIMHEPAALMTPPIKKLSRNRGLVIQEE